jgi:hypothetical protein
VRKKASGLRTKDDTAVVDAVVKRFLAKAITYQRQHMRAIIEVAKGEHSDNSLQGPLYPPCFAGLEEHFGIRVAAELSPDGQQIGTQLVGIVDLPVENDHTGIAGRAHRLMARLGEVNDRQPTKPKCQPHTLLHVGSAIIRPAEHDLVGHHCCNSLESRGVVPRLGVIKSYDCRTWLTSCLSDRRFVCCRLAPA